MKLEKKHYIIIGVVVAIILVWYFFLKKKKTESSFNKTVIREKTAIRESPSKKSGSVAGTRNRNPRPEEEESGHSGGGHGGGGHGGHGGGGHGWGGRGWGWGGGGGYWGWPYYGYDDQPIVVNSPNCPPGEVYRGVVIGCVRP